MKILISIVIPLVLLAVKVRAQDATAYVLSQGQIVNPDGSYSFNYETSNGILAQEQGLGGVGAQGAYSYTSPEGEAIKITYLADENGYQPSSDNLPTPPPIPKLIQKALEYIRDNPPSSI